MTIRILAQEIKCVFIKLHELIPQPPSLENKRRGYNTEIVDNSPSLILKRGVGVSS